MANNMKDGIMSRALDATTGKIRMEISSDLIPVCPDDGRKMTTNLRADDSFVEDAGWHAANQRYGTKK